MCIRDSAGGVADGLRADLLVALLMVADVVDVVGLFFAVDVYKRQQFTLIFDELKREKFVDWYGYSASVSPYILEQFEREVGYKFRPEYILSLIHI